MEAMVSRAGQAMPTLKTAQGRVNEDTLLQRMTNEVNEARNRVLDLNARLDELATRLHGPSDALPTVHREPTVAGSGDMRLLSEGIIALEVAIDTSWSILGRVSGSI